MSFSRRLLIYLSPRGAMVMRSGWRSLGWAGEFVASDEGLAQFSALLARHRRLPVTLMADSVDEDYRLESLPHASGRARRELQERKLRQFFRNAPFTAAIVQGRSREGRKDDHTLMVALTDSDWLHPWIRTIQQQQLPFAGLSLLALASENLLSRLKQQDAHVLLASQQSAGLRLSYFQNGRLRFSRLTRWDGAHSAQLNVADEVSRTQLYLASQRIMPRDARLTVLLLDFSASFAPAQASLNADPQFDARLITAEHIGQRLGIPAQLMVNAPETAFLAALPARCINLAPAAYSTSYQRHVMRRGLAIAGITALAASTAAAGFNWLQIREDRDEMQFLEASIRKNEALHRDTLRQLPRIPLSAESLTRVAENVRQIEAAPRAPHAVHVPISHALDRHPAIVLDTLAWQAPESGTRAAMISLEARVSPFNGNYREAMNRIRLFLSDLATQTGVTAVRLRAEPVDTASSTTLAGTTLQTAQAPEARFSVDFRFEERKP